MRWRPLRVVMIAVPLAVLLATVQFLFVPPAQSATASPTRIMALGDSITGSPGCWRALLWQKLQNNGYTNIDMVGTQPAQGCGFTYDGENEGHGGALVTAVADQGLLPGWLAATLPDIVLMHFGTNDAWSNKSTETILAAYTTLVNQMRASNANMRILVAQIIPMNPSSCAECAQRVVALNAAIPAWATTMTTSASPVTVVDQWTGFDDATDTSDGVHPNDAGILKMSEKWYPPLVSALNTTPITPTTPASSTPASSPASSSGSPSASPSASPSGSTGTNTGCTATYAITNQWATGFQGGITVRNTGTAAMTGWTVTFTYANGQTVTQAWNATYAQSGTAVTLANVDWNGTLTAGGSTTAGFIATWNGSANAVPATTCTAR